MTKKDYIKIVETLAGAVESIGAENVYTVGLAFANMLEKDNPRFDKARFGSYLQKCVGSVHA